MKTTKGDHLRQVMSENEWEAIVQMLHLAADRYEENAQHVRQILDDIKNDEPEHALITTRGARQLAEIHEQSAAKARGYAANLCRWLTDDTPHSAQPPPSSTKDLQEGIVSTTLER